MEPQSQQDRQVVLVTGASSGIGEAAASALLRRGALVVAAARRRAALAGLEQDGAHALHLDVTDEESRRRAVAEVVDRHGRIDVLVNNAGYGPLAAIEDTTPELWQRIFSTNVFGMADLSRLVLPHMRRAGRGRIVNVGSMGGEFTTPLGGAYHASKYAVEALTDALRAEARPFGIDVVLVQPGPVATPMAHSAADVVTGPGSAYTAAAAHLAGTTRAALAGGRGVLTPQRAARAVVTAVTAHRPRDRYKVGPVAHLMPLLRRRLPVRTWDAMMSRQTGLTRLAPGAPPGPATPAGRHPAG